MKDKSSNSTNIPFLRSIINDKTEPTVEDNASLFNKFFATIGYNISKHLKKPFTPNFSSEETSVFYQTNRIEIKGIVAQLDNKFLSGDDLMNNVLIKTSVEVVIQYLVFLYLIFLFRGEFSQKNWQKQKFSRFTKGDSKLKENNYRAISLLNAWSKIYERVVFNRIYYYFESRQLFYCKQFAFRSKHCTVDALVELTEKVRMRQSSSNVLCFFLDLKKTFDTINRDILLYKLERYGLR